MNNKFSVFYIILMVSVLIFGITTKTNAYSVDSQNTNPKLIQENRVEVFNSLLTELESIDDIAMKMQKIDEFMLSQQISGFPISNGDTVIFVYRTNTAQTVEISGRILDEGGVMDYVEGTDLFYKQFTLFSDSAGGYGFHEDGGNRLMDPLNNKTMACCGFRETSLLEMPEFTTDRSYDFNLDTGSKIINHSLTSVNTNRDYLVQVYLPAGYDNDSETRYNSVYVADGTSYLYELHANNTLDYLIYNDKIDPLIGVFITQTLKYRNSDLGNNRREHAQFIVEEVVPFIDSTYRTVNDSRLRGHVGLSMGAFFSLYIVAEHPEVFKLGGAQSPCGLSCHYSPIVSNTDYDSLVQFYAGSEKIEDARFYINAGTFESGRLQEAHAISKSLAEKGYEGKFRAFHLAHDNAQFRATLGEMLIFLFTDESSDYSGSPIMYGTTPGFLIFPIIVIAVFYAIKRKKK